MNGVLAWGGCCWTELQPDKRPMPRPSPPIGESLLSLIGDILDFSRSEAGFGSWTRIQVDCAAMLERVADFSTSAAISRLWTSTAASRPSAHTIRR